MNNAPSLPATTTAEQDLRTAGQRRINNIWEYTQAFIAVTVTTTVLTVTWKIVESTKENLAQACFLLLSNAFFLVIGFYFGRTNHARIGDIPKGSNLDDR